MTRKLQNVYVLEPAGSHGVWGLDDFHHVVYIFGATQFMGQDEIQPADILREAQSATSTHPSLFVSAVQNILATKRGAPFAETSPQLNDILESVPTWERICCNKVKLSSYKRCMIHAKFMRHPVRCTWGRCSRNSCGCCK